MKIIAMAAVLMLLVVNIGMAFQNEPEGFRGEKWGDLPTADMIPTNCENDKWNECFYLPNEQMTIGSVEFSKIIYSYYYTNRGLMSITLIFKSFADKEDYELLKASVSSKFGKPTKETMPFLAWKDLWIGDRTVIELNFKVFGGGYLKFYNPKLTAQKKKTDVQKEITEAADDF